MILKCNIYVESNLQVNPDEVELIKSTMDEFFFDILQRHVKDAEELEMNDFCRYFSEETQKRISNKIIRFRFLSTKQVQERIFDKPSFEEKPGIPIRFTEIKPQSKKIQVKKHKS